MPTWTPPRQASISGIFAATGQTCIAGSRLLVQSSIHDKFVERLWSSREVRQDRRSHAVGHQYRPDHHAAAVQEGARLHRHREGGRRALPARRQAGPGAGIGGGQFVEPTIFTDVDNTMRIAREEVFGPVLSIIRFDNEEEAVAIANDTIYGLAAGDLDQRSRRAPCGCRSCCGPEPCG